MRLLFRCQHVVQSDPSKVVPPMCPQCGERKVARVLEAPTPRLRGWGRGPLVASEALSPQQYNLAPAGSLPAQKGPTT